MTVLLGRDWIAGEQASLVAAVTAADKPVRDIKIARAGKRSRTRQEGAARQELLAALDSILTGAKRMAFGLPSNRPMTE